MANAIVVIGSLNTDLVVKVSRTPAPGETITGTSFNVFPGGKGANQAAAAARLGGSVSMIGCHGTDGFETVVLEALRGAGVSLAAVTKIDGSSGIAIISVTDDGQNSITIVPGANGQLSAQSVEQQRILISQANVVLTQLETPMEALAATLAIAKEHGVPVILDPAPAVALSAEVLHGVAWVTPNETEAAILLGKAVPVSIGEIAEYARELLRLGPKWVLLKLGRRGAFLAGKNGTSEYLPPYTVEVLDSTAAGDAVNGALAAGLAGGMAPLEAARFAVAAGALSVTKNGAMPSLPTLQELRLFTDTHSTRLPTLETA